MARAYIVDYGVGSFGYAIQPLTGLYLADPLRQLAQLGEVAMLGIRLGAQLLPKGSEEKSSMNGFGLTSSPRNNCKR